MILDDLHQSYKPGMTATIGKHTYRVEAPSAKDGLRLKLMLSDAEAAAEFDPMAEINTIFGGEIDADGIPQGGLWDDLDTNGVTLDEAVHLGMTAIHYFAFGAESAREYWGTLGKILGEETPKKKTRKRTS